jgi:hypothetical protein
MMKTLSADSISLAEKTNVGIAADEAFGSQLYPGKWLSRLSHFDKEGF